MSGVGKTALAVQFAENRFEESRGTTIGMDMWPLQLKFDDERETNIEIFDTGKYIIVTIIICRYIHENQLLMTSYSTNVMFS